MILRFCFDEKIQIIRTRIRKKHNLNTFEKTAPANITKALNFSLKIKIDKRLKNG